MRNAITAQGPRIGVYAGLALALMLVGSVTVARGGPGDRPAISGSAVVGTTLISSPAGDTGNYKWQRCDPDAATCANNTDRNDPNYVDIPGATGPNDRRYTLGDEDLGKLIRVQAKGTSLGTQFVPSAPVGPVIAPPVFRQTGVVDPACPLRVVEPGSGPETVDQLTNVPIGTRIDVSKCPADLITIRSARGNTQTVKVAGSAFKFFQRKKGKPVVILKLAGKFRAGRTATLAGAAGAGANASGRRFRRCVRILGRRKCRRLVARGDCLCSTSGRFASGTVRGSKWYVQDGPGYTFTKAIVHKLLVRDKARKKKILLKQGQSYTARKKRR